MSLGEEELGDLGFEELTERRLAGGGAASEGSVGGDAARRHEATDASMLLDPVVHFLPPIPVNVDDPNSQPLVIQKEGCGIVSAID